MTTRRPRASNQPITTDLVAGFSQVTVLLGLRHCGERSLLPYDAARRGNVIEIECPGCGLAVFSATLDGSETLP